MHKPRVMDRHLPGLQFKVNQRCFVDPNFLPTGQDVVVAECVEVFKDALLMRTRDNGDTTVLCVGRV